MSLRSHHPRQRPARSGFTLVELLTVMTIVAIMTGLGVAAFRGGSNGTGASGAASVASSVFAQARAVAIMHRTDAVVLVDTNTTSPTLFRRMIVVYFDAPTNTWKQASPWVTLPGNNYFDPIYSNPYGTLTSGLGLALPGDSGNNTYGFYAFDATGQASLLSDLNGFLTPGSPTVTASSATGQFVVSPGTVSNGTFAERNSTSRYGFYIFPLGRVAFFQDIANDLNTPPSNPWQP